MSYKPYEHTGTIADDYSLSNVLEMHGMLDLGRTVAPVLCDKETWDKLMKTREEYCKFSQMSGLAHECEPGKIILPKYLYVQLVCVARDFHEFSDKLCEAITQRCKEKAEERKKSEEEIAGILESVGKWDNEEAMDLTNLVNEMFGSKAD